MVLGLGKLPSAMMVGKAALMTGLSLIVLRAVGAAVPALRENRFIGAAFR